MVLTKKYVKDRKLFLRRYFFAFQDNPDEFCSKGGHAAYGAAVEIDNKTNKVGATYYMAYHTRELFLVVSMKFHGGM